MACLTLKRDLSLFHKIAPHFRELGQTLTMLLCLDSFKQLEGSSVANRVCFILGT